MIKDRRVAGYGAFGALVLLLYLVSESRGWVYGGTDEKTTISKDGRQGGRRSPGFWFTGYHGGK